MAPNEDAPVEEEAPEDLPDLRNLFGTIMGFCIHRIDELVSDLQARGEKRGAAGAMTATYIIDDIAAAVWTNEEFLSSIIDIARKTETATPPEEMANKIRLNSEVINAMRNAKK